MAGKGQRGHYSRRVDKHLSRGGLYRGWGWTAGTASYRRDAKTAVFRLREGGMSRGLYEGHG